MYLKFARTRSVKPPQRANHGDAGIDFFVPDDHEELSVGPGRSVLIPSGVRVEVPYGWGLIFFNKSGVATKKSLIVGACVVDHGYTGELHLHLLNVGNSAVTVAPGDKVAQGIMVPVGAFVPTEASPEELYAQQPVFGSNRGAGGFGSTGS